MMKMNTGEIIRDIRCEQKITIGKLAALSGVHYNTIQRFETGGDASLRNCEKILTALGYELDIMKCEN